MREKMKQAWERQQRKEEEGKLMSENICTGCEAPGTLHLPSKRTILRAQKLVSVNPGYAEMGCVCSKPFHWIIHPK